MQISNKQWSEVLKRVRKLANMPVVEYEALLQKLQIKDATPERLEISVPDDESLNLILSRYKDYFTSAISEVLKLQCEVGFEVAEENVYDFALSNTWRMTKAFVEVLEKKDWKYTVMQDGSIEVSKKLNNRLRNCDMIILFLAEQYYISGTVAVKADEDCFTEVSQFLHYANAEEIIGCFEINYMDGEIRYRLCMDCENEVFALPTEALLERNLNLPIWAFEKYGDALLDVIVGYKTAEEAFNEVNK